MKFSQLITATSLILAPIHLASATPAPAASKASSSAVAPSTVAAIILSKPVTIADIDKELDRRSMAMLVNAAHKDEKLMNQLRKGVLQSIINRTLLLDMAKKSTAVKEQDVQAAINSFVEKQGGKNAIDEKLKKQGKITYEQLIDDLKKDFTIRAFVENDLGKQVIISNEEIEKEFKTHPEKYSLPERVRARHVLIAVPEKASKEVEDAAKKKADETLAKLKQPGADFAKVASEISDDPTSKQRGGDLGYFTKGMMVPEFETAAFSAKPGDINGLVKSKYGYHIIKVEEHLAAETASLDKVKEQINEFLAGQKRGEIVQKKLEQLKKEGAVAIKLKELESAKS